MGNAEVGMRNECGNVEVGMRNGSCIEDRGQRAKGEEQ